MNSWTITNLDFRPHSPEILASTDDARAIALMIPAGESFDDHQVHESAWVTVIDGEVVWSKRISRRSSADTRALSLSSVSQCIHVVKVGATT